MQELMGGVRENGHSVSGEQDCPAVPGNIHRGVRFFK